MTDSVSPGSVSSGELSAAEAAEAAQQRAAARDSTFLQAIVTRADGLGGALTLRVRNLSDGGMMADCAAAFARGDEIVVELRGIGRIEARIAWAREGRIGVSFAIRIDPIAARKAASRPTPLGFQLMPPPSDRSRRPGLQRR